MRPRKCRRAHISPHQRRKGCHQHGGPSGTNKGVSHAPSELVRCWSRGRATAGHRPWRVAIDHGASPSTTHGFGKHEGEQSNHGMRRVGKERAFPGHKPRRHKRKPQQQHHHLERTQLTPKSARHTLSPVAPRRRPQPRVPYRRQRTYFMVHANPPADGGAGVGTGLDGASAGSGGSFSVQHQVRALGMSLTGLVSSPTGTSSDEAAKKIRKPYTITKSRENWTEQEHDKFLEALQL
ncbi:hypothetical protein BHE74_00001130 [Ensete ventricosum]|nr:hypothetical protein GW17_00005210 [Ensete ventricosum]RWW89831.1 hypothetical protein BHE74_00001130 [Ensete ventricosum]RZR76832.1 hypothetical protein BHM03_00001719 [Ensete ventricosum]